MIESKYDGCRECLFHEACEGFNQNKEAGACWDFIEPEFICIAQSQPTWPLCEQVEKLHKEASDAISY